MDNNEIKIKDISDILDNKISEMKDITGIKNAIVVTFVEAEGKAGFLASSLNLDTTSAVAAFLCDFISQTIKSSTVVSLEEVLDKLKEENDKEEKNNNE